MFFIINLIGRKETLKILMINYQIGYHEDMAFGRAKNTDNS